MNIKDIIITIKNKGRCAQNYMRTPEHRAQDGTAGVLLRDSQSHS